MADDEQRPHDLTLKQQLFAESYVGPARGNATEAARLAGYTGNDVTLNTTAHRTLRNAQVASYVQSRVAAAVATADEVLAELTAVAFAPWESSIKVRYSKTGEIVDAQIVLADKVRALELIGKYHGLFREKVDVTHEEVVRVLAYIKPPGVE